MVSRSINEIADAVIVADENGVTDYMNRAAEAITEWPHGEAQGMRLTEVLRLHDISTDSRIPTTEAMESGVLVVTLGDETLLETRNGSCSLHSATTASGCCMPQRPRLGGHQCPA